MTPSTQYSRMPGGGISRRPLHIIVLADCSWGMKGEKIQALNYAIADMMPHLAEWEQDQEQAQVFVRAIAFATEPRWHIRDPVPVTGIRWKPLQAVPKGLTNYRRPVDRQAGGVRGRTGGADGTARGEGSAAAVHRHRP
jgi:hypothetical protein